MEKRGISMDGAWSTQTGKRQCHVTGNWKGDYPWGLQACWSRFIDLVHQLTHLWVGARCFWVGRVLFVSLKFWMQSEDAQAIFVGASETNEAGSSWRYSFHFAQKENCRQKKSLQTVQRRKHKIHWSTLISQFWHRQWHQEDRNESCEKKTWITAPIRMVCPK